MEYSKCNVALLRDALESELSRDESQLLARCLMGIITAPDKFRHTLKAGATSNALHCLSALRDSLHGSLSDDEGKASAQIHKAVSKTEIILSLQMTLEESVESIGSSAAGRSEACVQLMNDKKLSTSLPPYQIERLVF